MPVPTRAKEPLIETLPFEERIRRRAHELYVQRGNQSGSEFDDWLQAEEEMLQAQEQVIDEAKTSRRGQKKSGRIWVIGVSAPAVVTGVTYETMRRRIMFEKFSEIFLRN
jgi:hypothetical protein